MVTFEEAYKIALQYERVWEDGSKDIISGACERPDAWGFTISVEDQPWCLDTNIYISKADGHEFSGPPVPPLENLEWYRDSKVIPLP